MRRNERTALTGDELIRVLEAAKAHSIRDWALLLVIYRHGLRASEAANLTLGDIKEGYLTVARVKGSLKTTQAITGHPGQPILSEEKALAEWKKHRVPDGSNALFTSRKGGNLTREQVYRIFRQHAETAKLPPEKRFVHILKHTLATHLVNGDENLAIVKEKLGHKSLSSTARYLHPSAEEVDKRTQATLIRYFKAGA
jgi:site-specific recombinase XerD